MSEWKPIESAPKTNESRLVFCPDNECIYAVCWDHSPSSGACWIIFGTSTPLVYKPSLWMPMPQPPGKSVAERIVSRLRKFAESLEAEFGTECSLFKLMESSNA